MRRNVLATLPVLGLLLSVPALAQDDLMTEAQDLFEPIPTAPPEIEGNPATPEKVELGRMLYFDPRLSESHTISCNSCHVVGLGGVDMLETSVGHRWQRGGRNAPTVLNSVLNTAQFWDGRAKDLGGKRNERGRDVPFHRPHDTNAHACRGKAGLSGTGATDGSFRPECGGVP